MDAALAAPSLTVRFAAVVELLTQGLAANLRQHRENTPLALVAWTRLLRLFSRFAALAAAVEAGRVFTPRRTTKRTARPRPAAAAPQTTATAAAAAPAVKLPGRPGWLLRLAPELETRIGRSQLETLLYEPELAAVVAKAPQTIRLLRPFCHMLGIAPPPALRLPPRPRVRRRPDRSGATEAGAASEAKPPQPARPPLPFWLIRPPTPPLPRAERVPAAASPRRTNTGPPRT